ncbi:hypothetical protein EV702DRAFT_1270984 [Suillus placidus]|uniref:Uncharacterized protein n=1 Tax=Suillus placidus TaxID=48579 RepID=A0A9P6ZLY0_9AGAM|nr:hypothetical protein EV702DRAFT_1270984 [Suillus placidus]
MSDVDLVRHLKNHYDQEEYGLRSVSYICLVQILQLIYHASVISFRRMRNSWGWKRTRVLQVTESIMISGVLLVTSIQQPSALSSCLSILNMSMFSSMMYPRSAPLGLGFLCSCHHGQRLGFKHKDNHKENNEQVISHEAAAERFWKGPGDMRLRSRDRSASIAEKIADPRSGVEFVTVKVVGLGLGLALGLDALVM